MVRAVLPILLALFLAAPALARTPIPKPILTVSVGPAFQKKSPRPDTGHVEIEVMSDGSFLLDGRPGQLPRPALRELQRTIAKTRLVLAPRPQINCMAIPVRRTHVKTQRGSVSWAAPCDRSPHASVTTLVQTARALLGDHLHAQSAPTPLVTYRVTKHRSPFGGEALTLMSDGAWERHDARGPRSGVLTPAELRALVVHMGSVRVGPSPRPHACGAMLEGEGSVTLDGVGSHDFSVPCSELDPTLSAFLSELRSLTR